MSAAVEEPMILDVLDVVFCEGETTADRDAWHKNHSEILAANRDASVVEGEALAAFLDLLSGADTEYLDAEAYAPEPQLPAVDWESVSQALGESQGILIGVQKLLSETLAAMGVEGHENIRVYADRQGDLRLLSDHPRREEIESHLNSPANTDLRYLYRAAMDGMSLAGGLVCNLSVPQEVLDRLKAKQTAA